MQLFTSSAFIAYIISVGPLAAAGTEADTCRLAGVSDEGATIHVDKDSSGNQITTLTMANSFSIVTTTILWNNYTPIFAVRTAYNTVDLSSGEAGTPSTPTDIAETNFWNFDATKNRFLSEFSVLVPEQALLSHNKAEDLGLSISIGATILTNGCPKDGNP